MNFQDLASIDWDAFETTTDWTKLLNDLLGLTQVAGVDEHRSELADRLDDFADHSSSDDLDAITKLDRLARKAARALRMADIGERIAGLQNVSSEFQAVVKELGAATQALSKEASLLRGEKVKAAVTSLTASISSLKALSQAIASDDDAKLGAAITQAVASAQKLRALLEKPA